MLNFVNCEQNRKSSDKHLIENSRHIYRELSYIEVGERNPESFVQMLKIRTHLISQLDLPRVFDGAVNKLRNSNKLNSSRTAHMSPIFLKCTVPGQSI